MIQLNDFLDDNFNATAYTRKALASMNGSREELDAFVREIKSSIGLVDGMIEVHVEKNNDAMLSRLQLAGSCRDALVEVQAQSQSVDASVSRLVRDINHPLANLKTNSKHMRNIQHTIMVISRCRRFFKALAKLRSTRDSIKETPSSRELSRIAQYVSECESLLSDNSVCDIREINSVKGELEWFEETSRDLRFHLKTKFRECVLDGNQLAEVAALCQAYVYLGDLLKEVHEVIEWTIGNIATEVKAILDVRNLSPSRRVKPLKSEEGIMKKKLWEELDKVEGVIQIWSTRMWNLHRVLMRKRDATSHRAFSEFFGQEQMYEFFWNRTTQALHGEVDQACRMFPFIRTCLGIQEYPRLRHHFRQIGQRVTIRNNARNVRGTDSNKSAEQITSLLRSLQPLLEVYLAQSLRSLNEPVELMFPRDTTEIKLPTVHDALTFVKRIDKELTAVKGDHELVHAIAKGAGKAILSLSSKCNNAIVSEDLKFPLESVSTPIPDTVAHNIGLLQVVVKLLSQIQTFAETYDDSNGDIHSKIVQQTFMEPLRALKSSVEAISKKYVFGLCEELNQVIGKIHMENFAPTSKLAFNLEQESPYLIELEQKFEIVRRIYLKPLVMKDFTDFHQYTKLLVTRLVALFCRHVSLIRPLNAQGKLRVAKDLAQFELIVTPLALDSNFKISSIGDIYTELRALRSLIFLEYAGVATMDDSLTKQLQELAKSMRVTTIWHSVFAEAPEELRSPYMMMHADSRENSSRETEYVNWMHRIETDEEHTEENDSTCSFYEPRHLKVRVWDGISTCMDKYMQLRSANATQGALCIQFELLKSLRELVHN